MSRKDFIAIQTIFFQFGRIEKLFSAKTAADEFNYIASVSAYNN